MSSLIVSGNTSGSITLSAPAISGSSVLTLPVATDTLVGKATTDTLTNKTLTSPTITGATITVASTAAPCFSAYSNSSQTGVANTTSTKITFDTESFDTNSNFASSRFTPTVAGYYQLNASSAVGSLTTSYGLFVAIYKNGSQYSTGTISNSNSALYPQSVVSSILYFNGSTDYAEIYVYGSFGGSYSLLAGIYNTYFNGAMVRSA